MAGDLGLAIELYQPFRDFEGVSDVAFRRNLDRAERKFDVMGELGAPNDARRLECVTPGH